MDKTIVYTDSENPTVSSDKADFDIAFIKDQDFFMVFDNWVSFIKGVEKTIRQSDSYSQYIAHISELGLTKCQVLGHVDSNMSELGHKVSVEMHHGPLLTLFDYVSIVITYMLKHKQKITSMRVAKIVMDEHWLGNVQTVMLSATAHAAVDSGKMFISFDQGHGNIINFLKKYRDGITDEQREKINKFIRMSYKWKSTDNGLFDLHDTMKNWNIA